ncbi:3-oxoacyl-ACP reductase FabG [Finegoldia sp. BIOML-A1]|uniref:elongation factor P 5-aminopentanone reductase n=1 Tax=Finegoldia sp. BIOML-A1 TaxID=2584649 RepID=UPI0012AFF424|nr:3-oxoacyl-ACP reductase FabG [Finegoldia sp. BIOML-A1]MSB10709.1 SDR family oxidoreductase [Finegoldia sp. BIOML-A1]
MKTILITGASGGIGEGICKMLENHPEYRIVVHYFNNEEKAKQIVENIRNKGIDAIAYKCDLRKFDECEKMFDFIRNKFRCVDILINNAGISIVNQFQDISVDDWYNMFDVNVHGTYHMSKLALEDMLDNKEGNIINISSIWGMIGGSMESCYSATKAAIIGLTKSLAKEFGYSNIKINAIAPGAIDTPMLDNISSNDLDYVIEDTPMGRLGTPEDIANLVEFLISDKNSFMTGQILSPNGGFVIV